MSEHFMSRRFPASVGTRKGDKAPFLLWPLLIVAMIVVIFALSSESFFTTDGRIALLAQSGLYP
jgi:hypothetical protein